MGILEKALVWLLGSGFVIGMLGASLVLVITFLEDLKMLFAGTEED